MKKALFLLSVICLFAACKNSPQPAPEEDTAVTTQVVPEAPAEQDSELATYLATFDEAVAEQRDLQSAPALSDASSPDEVDARFAEIIALDQFVRNPPGLMELVRSPADIERAVTSLEVHARPIDLAHAREIKAWADANGWPSVTDHGEPRVREVALVFLHVEDDALQNYALAHMKEMEGKGESPADLSAYMVDKIAVRQGQPQTYGTQGECGASGAWEPFAIDEPEQVDARRQSAGLEPLEDYAAQFHAMCGMMTSAP